MLHVKKRLKTNFESQDSHAKKYENKVSLFAPVDSLRSSLYSGNGDKILHRVQKRATSPSPDASMVAKNGWRFATRRELLAQLAGRQRYCISDAGDEHQVIEMVLFGPGPAVAIRQTVPRTFEMLNTSFESFP
jgi:hypothetical protein